MKLTLVLVAMLSLAVSCSKNGEEATQTSTLTTSASASPNSQPTETLDASPTSPPASASPSLAGVLIVTFDENNGPVELTVELADSPDERYQGLRNRQSLGEDSGMIFAWPNDAQSAFGMPETYIPLSIAFVRQDGTIAHMEDMEPLSTQAYRSPEPYRFAIEVSQGWFAENGIQVGDVARVPAEASAAAQ
jgi:uncharacterized membrane protein (UPF0127 family)